MKFLDEFRNPEIGKILVGKIRGLLEDSGGLITLMEICGTHTMSIARNGIRGLFPGRIRMLSGPGCPVCVTPNEYLDRAVAFSRRKDILLATFGDMMKVPGSSSSLLEEKTGGAEIAVVYSPMDALALSKRYPDRKVIFLGVGFETTAPTIAATLKSAREANLKNFYVFGANKLVPPAIRALLDDPKLEISGFLCPGHVSTIIGDKPYEFAAKEYGVPCVIAGFEPMDILESMRMIVETIAGEKEAKVEIQYLRAVKPEGNPRALEIMNEVFEPGDSIWRGLGNIPGSGLHFREEYREFDAESEIPVEVEETREDPSCICGEILRGVKSPKDCPLFRKACHPGHPVGPCMVSTEGTCAAWYKYEI